MIKKRKRGRLSHLELSKAATVDELESILSMYCQSCGITTSLLRGPIRYQEIAFHRVVLGTALFEQMKASYTNVAKAMNRNHATIIHYVKKYHELKDIYPEYVRAYKIAASIIKEFRQEDNTSRNVTEVFMNSNKKLISKVLSQKWEIKELIAKIKELETKTEKINEIIRKTGRTF